MNKQCLNHAKITGRPIEILAIVKHLKECEELKKYSVSLKNEFQCDVICITQSVPLQKFADLSKLFNGVKILLTYEDPKLFLLGTATIEKGFYNINEPNRKKSTLKI